MKAERLHNLARDGVAFDFETHKIQPGLLAPPIVCGSVGIDDDGIRGDILPKETALDVLETILTDKTLIGANAPYDLGCAVVARPHLLPLIFRALDEHRVYDVLIAEQLHAIAQGTFNKDPRTGAPLDGRYNLDNVTSMVLGRDNAKVNDYWRKRYALLEEIPLDEWPPDARAYPVDDAVNTIEDALTQVGHLERAAAHEFDDACTCAHCGFVFDPARFEPFPACVRKVQHRNLHDLANQVDTNFCLHLGAIWGFRVDPEMIEYKYRIDDADADPAGRQLHPRRDQHPQHLHSWTVHPSLGGRDGADRHCPQRGND